eukprot:7131615-Pyramimonas_sp.AAC.1
MSRSEPLAHASSCSHIRREHQLVTVSSAALVSVAVPRGAIGMGRMWAQLAIEKISARDKHCGGRCHALCKAHDSRAMRTFGAGYSCCKYPNTGRTHCCRCQ